MYLLQYFAVHNPVKTDTHSHFGWNGCSLYPERLFTLPGTDVHFDSGMAVHFGRNYLHFAPDTQKRWTGPLLLKWVNQEFGTAFTAIYKLLNKIAVEHQNGEGYVVQD